jgi:hypothetical protein
METDTETRAGIQIKSVADARVFLALNDVPQQTLADLIGTDKYHLSRVLHARRPLTTLMRIRIEKGLKQIAEEGAEVKPPTPRIRRL